IRDFHVTGVQTCALPIFFRIVRHEFFQIGLIALWKAYMAYDPEKGTFETFAYSYIRGSILTELRKLRKTDDKEMFLDEFAMISIPDVESLSFENQFQIEDLVEKLP